MNANIGFPIETSFQSNQFSKCNPFFNAMNLFCSSKILNKQFCQYKHFSIQVVFFNLYVVVTFFFVYVLCDCVCRVQESISSNDYV